jgi:hypothetical protein
MARNNNHHAVLDIGNLLHIRSYTYTIHKYTITAICRITITSSDAVLSIHSMPLNTELLDFTGLGDFTIHTVSLLITQSGHIVLFRLLITFLVASCYQRCSLLHHSGKRCHVTAGEEGRCVEWPFTVAAALLAVEWVSCMAQIYRNELS